MKKDPTPPYWRDPRWPSRGLVGLVGLVFMLLIPVHTLPGARGSQPVEDDNLVYEDFVKYYELFLWQKGDEVTVTVTFGTGERGDVYIMTFPQVKRLQNNETFTPRVYRENVTRTSFEWTNPDGELFYIVIDNKDNPRPDDAKVQPGELHYLLIYEQHSNFGGRTLKLFLIVIVSTLVICGAGVLVAFKVKRGRWPRFR